MKAIVLGAGRGMRLRPHTDEIPKCLVDGLGGRLLLDWIVDALNNAGLTDIVFVGGYQHGRVRERFPVICHVENSKWDSGGILQSLFAAEEHFGDSFVVSYADTVYRPNVVQRLAESDAEVAIVVDRDWRRRYVGRHGHREADAEKVITQHGKVKRVGKHVGSRDADGEFVGLAKVSGGAVELMRAEYWKAMNDGQERPFAHAPTLQCSYLTDMLEVLIERGVDVEVIEIWGDWVEINTQQDLAFARDLLAEGADEALTREFWSIRSRHYGELEWASRGDYLQSVVDSSELFEEARVLDVGTGTGIVAHAVSPHVQQVVGIDLSPDMLNRAIESRKPNELFERGDVRNLSYPSAFFDRVIARMVFHHVLPDPVIGLRECYRVLKPGGLLNLSEGTPPDPYLRDWYTRMFALKEERLTFFEGDLLELLVRAGFEVHVVGRHLSEQVSIRNWLRASGLPSETQDAIFQMHLDLDDRGKQLYNMTVTQDDVMCDFSFVNAVGQRPMKG